MIEILLQAEAALSVGLLDRAEILYRQVAAADPRNSIAVVGLARVMLERGDEPGALAQARRALAIDAENVAAQRMVQRLDEVLRFRGVEVPAALPPMPGTAMPVPPADPGSGPARPSPAAAAAEASRRSLIDRLLRRR